MWMKAAKEKYLKYRNKSNQIRRRHCIRLNMYLS
jgi:hypothetical protein